MKKRISWAIGIAAALATLNAAAATIYLQPSSGHPWNVTSPALDGRYFANVDSSVGLCVANDDCDSNMGLVRLWATPVQLINHATGSVAGYQTRSANAANPEDAASRMVSFNRDGSLAGISSLGTLPGGYSYAGGVSGYGGFGSVVVPADGTVFIQSQLSWHLNGTTMVAGKIHSFKVTYPSSF